MSPDGRRVYVAGGSVSSAEDAVDTPFDFVTLAYSDAEMLAASPAGAPTDAAVALRP